MRLSWGRRLRISCCPICTYIVKNDSVFLNHIVICHYWSSFSCGKCLEFVVSSGQQMKKHFLKCHGIKDAHVSRRILRAASHPSHMAVANPAASPRRTRRTRVTSAVKRRKVIRPHGSESKSGNKAASQEQVLESLHHSKCIAESSAEGGHHKSHKK